MLWREIDNWHQHLSDLLQSYVPENATQRLAWIEPTIRHLETETRWAASAAVALEWVIPLAEEALLQKEISAWVGANDEFALACLALLWSKGVRVPGEIAVTGFDNTSEAYRHDLTSYSLNAEDAVRAMVRHVISPMHDGIRSHALVVPVHGRMVCRASTAGG
jgi:DNA-binding LacI/PurR family transcriptional regulator